MKILTIHVACVPLPKFGKQTFTSAFYIPKGSYTDTADSNIDCSYYYITVKLE
ncbi:MAG: hypothetical protein NWS71_11915 [Opitutales bacterium]|nr:hypothetical protein [Opitutales bacterium]